MPFHQNLSFSAKIISSLGYKERRSLLLADEEPQQRKDALLLSCSPLWPSGENPELISPPNEANFINVCFKMTRHECALHETDEHSECVACLSRAHAEAALTETACCHCESMSLALLCSRIAFFSEGDPAPHALPFLSSQEPWRKKQQSQKAEQTGSCQYMARMPCLPA